MKAYHLIRNKYTTYILSIMEDDIIISGINRRVLQIIEYLNVTRYRFSQETSISEPVLLNIYKGKNKPSYDVLEKILNRYSVFNAEWLITGKGSMLNKKSIGASYGKAKWQVLSLSQVCEEFKSDWRVGEKKAEIDWIPAFGKADFMVTIEGESMTPKYLAGDIAVCRKLDAEPLLQWNKTYLLDTDLGAMIKRVRKGVTEESVLIVSENRDFEPFELERSRIHHYAELLGIIRLE
jgi:repressor LexA